MKKIICAIFGHDVFYWEEVIDHVALTVEFKKCERCDEFFGVVDVKES